MADLYCTKRVQVKYSHLAGDLSDTKLLACCLAFLLGYDCSLATHITYDPRSDLSKFL